MVSVALTDELFFAHRKDTTMEQRRKGVKMNGVAFKIFPRKQRQIISFFLKRKPEKMAINFVFSLFFSFLISFSNCDDKIACKNEAGKAVDWFIGYKLPREKNRDNEKVTEGVAYAFFDSENAPRGWKLSDKSADDPDSAFARTLAPLYGAKAVNPDLLYLMYNDEHPDGNVSFADGHTKGVIGFDQKEGFWLVHSVPKFPPSPEGGGGYGYPSTGRMYGQSFLCVSLDTKYLDSLGVQLMFNRPFIYGRSIPAWAATRYPHFALAANGKHVKKAPFFRAAGFKSRFKSVRFISFAKYTSFGEDLYADLVAPALKTGMFVETWPNGPGRMPSNCTGSFKVENVDAVDFGRFVPDLNTTFSTKHDHAKWAAAALKPDKEPYVCVGDINRMNSQRHRAGGTLCFSDKTVWKNYKSIIKGIETC